MANDGEFGGAGSASHALDDVIAAREAGAP